MKEAFGYMLMLQGTKKEKPLHFRKGSFISLFVIRYSKTRYFLNKLTIDSVEAFLRVILEWPSKVAAEGFMNDPDYIPHLKARTDEIMSSFFNSGQG